MENRLKERLTGAAILVALIVLLVPEMFHGQRRDGPASAGSSGEGPPLRSYTIDLSNGPARTAPLQATAPQGTGAAGEGGSDSGATAAAPTAAASAAPTLPPPSSAPSAGAARAATAATGSGSTSAAAGSKAAGSPVAHAAAGPAGWSVQLGLFAQRDNAERLMHSAQSKGFTVSVSEADAKGLFHVQVGNLSDRAAAQAMAVHLHDQGFAAAVVAPAAGAARKER